ncbi:hypothetical protein K9M79_00930 [Candidatus Woesearchaeota archaeon]|nr:hypothetical protein [Candidatus Woesearchaeota archaeon]
MILFFLFFPLCSCFIYPSSGNFDVSRGDVFYLKAEFVNIYGKDMVVNISDNDLIGFGGLDFIVEEGRNREFFIPIRLNSSMQNGIYNVSIPLQFSIAGKEDNGVKLKNGVVLGYQINLTGIQTFGGNIVNISSYPCEAESMCIFDLSVRNNGSVSIYPNISLKLRPNIPIGYLCSPVQPNHKEVCRVGVNVSEYSYTKMDISKEARNEIYQVKLVFIVKHEDMTLDEKHTTVRIFPAGSLSYSGSLVDFEVNDCSYGEIVKFSANFRNEGQKPLDVYFISEVFSVKGLLSVIESDKKTVIPGEIIQLQDYFYPPRPGRYEFRTRAFFAGRASDEIIRSINVRGEQDKWSSFLIIGLIFFLSLWTYKIYKSK